MKLSKLLIIAIAALFFSACSTEEEPLARHELVFQASMGNNETRATSDGSWTVGDIVAVRVGTTVKKYQITTPDGKLCGADAYNTFYWEDFEGSSVEVTAWSFGQKYVSSVSDGGTIESDQSVEEKYYNSDFLYAKSTLVNKGDLSILSFFHQMARVNINIKYDEATEIDMVELGSLDNASSCYVQANYTEPIADSDEDPVPNYGTFDTDYDDYGVAVIPYKVSTVTNYDASYSAIIVPFPYEAFGICITLKNGSKFSYIGGIYSNNNNVYPFDPGTVNTFNITIKNKELTVDGFVNEMGQPIDPVSVNDWREQN